MIQGLRRMWLRRMWLRRALAKQTCRGISRDCARCRAGCLRSRHTPLRRASPTCIRQAIAKVSRYRAAIAEQLARRRARALAFLQDGLPVDHNPTIAFATADPAPLVGRDVVQDLLRQR